MHMMRYWEEKKEVLTDETETSNIEISTAVGRASYGVDGAHGDKKKQEVRDALKNGDG